MPGLVHDRLKQHEPDDLVSLSEVAWILDASPSTVTRWTKEGLLPCRRMPGARNRYRVGDLPVAWEQIREHISVSPLQAARHARGLTGEQVATMVRDRCPGHSGRECRFSPDKLSDIELGKRGLSWQHLVSLTDVYEVTPERLGFGVRERPDSPPPVSAAPGAAPSPDPPPAVSVLTRAPHQPRWSKSRSPLQAARYARGLTGEQVATMVRDRCPGHSGQECRFSQGKLSSHETGKSDPGKNHLLCLADIYQATPEQLGYGVAQERPDSPEPVTAAPPDAAPSPDTPTAVTANGQPSASSAPGTPPSPLGSGAVAYLVIPVDAATLLLTLGQLGISDRAQVVTSADLLPILFPAAGPHEHSVNGRRNGTPDSDA